MNSDNQSLRLYWGDLHNHNAVGYAKGSLERTIDIAREHLDFFAFTGHASWHDMPKMPGDRHMVWVNGFAAHEQHWPKTRKMIQEANDETFGAFLVHGLIPGPDLFVKSGKIIYAVFIGLMVANLLHFFIASAGL